MFMNETIRELYQRKSMRVFSDRPIEEEKKQMLFSAALQAPSAGNMTLYSMIDITDQELKDRLSVTCDNQPFIREAPIILIFCADYQRWYDTFLMTGREIRKPGYGDFMLSAVDTVIAAQNAVVAGESMGLGSCYIGDILENYETHRELLNLPKYVMPVVMLCFGYPHSQQMIRPKPPRFSPQYIVHQNQYQQADSQTLVNMLTDREQKSEKELESYLEAFLARKWNCDFSEEMSRSVEQMFKSWME